MKAGNSRSHPDNPPTPREAVTYADLLSIAHDEGLKSIQTQILAQPTEENGHRCIVKAVVEIEKGRFEGIGDADPGNVEGFLAPHLIRVAETRAKARALRDAVNCGILSPIPGCSGPPADVPAIPTLRALPDDRLGGVIEPSMDLPEASPSLRASPARHVGPRDLSRRPAGHPGDD